jgi:hypothetical protein
MTWAQRLKRVFNIDIAIREECDSDAWLIANIEDRGKKINDRSGHLSEPGEQNLSIFFL